uniref:hypothetical protein n=1 Tax=Leucobacter musarum TaxID=1930747 RepID=UPI000B267198
MEKRRNFRRMAVAGMTAAVAFTGVGFGATMANADEGVVSSAISGDTVKGRLIFKYDPLRSINNGTGERPSHTSHESVIDALASAELFTVPAPGKSGTITNSLGKCFTPESSGYPFLRFADCSGAANQNFRVNEQGQAFGFNGSTVQLDKAGTVSLTGTDRPGIAFDLMTGVFGQADSVDLSSRTADISGFAVPGATLLINGTEQVTAAADGSWSYTVLGLNLTTNDIKVEQYEG